jgi:hypothetical protein
MVPMHPYKVMGLGYHTRAHVSLVFFSLLDDFFVLFSIRKDL